MTQARIEPSPRVWRGHVGWTLTTVVASGALAYVLVPVLFADTSAEIGIVRLALVGLAIGFVGAAMRACAHRRDALSWLDHLGKLFNVAAIAFALWATAARMGEESAEIAWILIRIGLYVLAVLVVIWIVWILVVLPIRQKLRANRPEPAA